MNDNYQIILDKTIDNIIRNNEKPTLLLHSCCAPCSSYVLEYLSKYFFITVFYYNPNISSKEEYLKRMSEQKRFIEECNFVNPVKFVDAPYDNEKFENMISGLEKEQEGGLRCHKCYYLRLEETAKFASNNCFDYFTTTLSISPYKSSKILNEIGKKLSEIYNVKYLYSDFKKKNGYKRSIELSHIYNLYRQNYCGCKYSKKENKED